MLRDRAHGALLVHGHEDACRLAHRLILPCRTPEGGETHLIGCCARPRRLTLPNLKVYRAALAVALALIVIALFTLGRPGTPKLSDEPVSFDGTRAAADMREIVTQFPQRVAGSDADNRAGMWVRERFDRLGLESHVQGFPAKIDGRDVALQNVWAVAKGDTPGTIIVIANRDIPPRATQGANDNASGVAALLELARSFTVASHHHSIVFLATTGDAFGALGARQFAEQVPAGDITAVIALRQMATREREGIGIDGWSTAPQAAPPWLWLLSGPAARVYVNDQALLPGVAAQVIHLAAPTSPGSQGPFVAEGVPGVTVTAEGPGVDAVNDTLDNVSNSALTKAGSAAQAMVLTIDGAAVPEARSGGTIFLTRQRTLSGTAVMAMLSALLLPLIAVTVDLFAHCRREGVQLRAAFVRAGLHLAPWLIVVAIVYLANLFGLLPQSPGAIIPPGSPVVAEPYYLRAAMLLALLLLAYAYAVAVERRLERRVRTDPRATIFVAHFSLIVVALAALLVNPYSLLFVVPAAVLWPLARPGGWHRSILPAYLGLAMIPIALVYIASSLDLGWNVWWYSLLLIETRTIPAAVVLSGVFFLSSAGVLAHELHERAPATDDLSWQHQDRRKQRLGIEPGVRPSARPQRRRRS